MEIITGIERRRRWRDEDKLRIVGEAEQPGACFADVARRYKISRGLLWNWRQQVRRGALASDAAPIFMPLRIIAEHQQSSPPLPTTRSSPRTVEASRIEIALADGTCIRVGDDVCLTALRRVMSALRR
jgi:transposase